MATRHAVFVPFGPLLARRSSLCLFQQPKQQPLQQALRFSVLARRPLASFPWRSPSLATAKLAGIRSYSTQNPHQGQTIYTQPPPPEPEPKKRSRIWRTISFLFRAWLYIGIGSVIGKFVAMTLWPGASTYRPKLQSPEALDAAQRVTDHIMNHPLVRQLEANPKLKPTHPHYKIHPYFRLGNVTADTLIGPGLMAIPPLIWQDDAGQELVMILHAGKGLCGHPDIVHGGFVATLLDETLARCCFAAMPGKIAMTANLKINYRAPTPADSYLVLRAHTQSVNGRKAIVQGRLETLPDPDSGEPGKLLAEAEGLFISPKIAPYLDFISRMAGSVRFDGPTYNRIEQSSSIP